MSLPAFPGRKLWTRSKVGKAAVGVLHSRVPGDRVPTQLRPPSTLQKTLKSWKLLWQRGSGKTEESQGLQRRHPPVPPSDLPLKWRPPRTGTVPGAPPRHGDRRGPPGAGGRSGPKRTLSLADGPEGASLGTAPLRGSMLRPEVLFTAGLPPGSLVWAVRWRLPRSAMW